MSFIINPHRFSTAWTPADLTLLGWWDASDTSTITESSGAVSQWDDLSGNGRHLAQSTAGLKPTTGVDTQNGLNVIKFDGTEYMADSGANSLSYWNSVHNGDTISIFAVFSPGLVADPNATMYLMGNNGGSSSNRGFVFRWDDSAAASRNNTIVQFATNAGTAPLANVASNDIAPAQTFSAVRTVWNCDAPTGAARGFIAVNDGTVYQNNTSTSTPSASNAAFALHMAAASGSTTNAFAGHIAEVVVVGGGSLSAGEEDNMWTYLMGKWGIS